MKVLWETLLLDPLNDLAPSFAFRITVVTMNFKITF